MSKPSDQPPAAGKETPLMLPCPHCGENMPERITYCTACSKRMYSPVTGQRFKPKPVQESAPLTHAYVKGVWESDGCRAYISLRGMAQCGKPRSEHPPQPEAEAPRPPAAPSPEAEDYSIQRRDAADEGPPYVCLRCDAPTYDLRPCPRCRGEEPPRGAAAGEELAREAHADCCGCAGRKEPHVRRFAKWLAQAREEGRKAGLEEAAKSVTDCQHQSLHYFGRNGGVACDVCPAMWTRMRQGRTPSLIRTGFGGGC